MAKPASGCDRVDGRAFQIRRVDFGDFYVRLAVSAEDVRSAQSLRYQIFYHEQNAEATAENELLQRDVDEFDAQCDHLLVMYDAGSSDESEGGAREEDRSEAQEEVVGTYRLLRHDVAKRTGGFYSDGEFDLSSIYRNNRAALEVGRSCIDHRFRRSHYIMNGLWRGIAEYTAHYGVDLIFGCASFPGTDPSKHDLALSYLYYHHRAPEEYSIRALPERFTPMDRLPLEQVNQATKRSVMRTMPPLIRGYLGLGGWIGDGAVIDPILNTVDVCVQVDLRQVGEKYFRHYLQDLPRVQEMAVSEGRE